MMTDDQTRGEFKWTCEKCRRVAFDVYDEACAHEMICDGLMNVCTSDSKIKESHPLSKSKIQLNLPSHYSDSQIIHKKSVKSRSQPSSVPVKTKRKENIMESTTKKVSKKSTDQVSCRVVEILNGITPIDPTLQDETVSLAPIFKKKPDKKKIVEPSTNILNIIQKDASLHNKTSSQFIQRETNQNTKVTGTRSKDSSFNINSKRRKLVDTNTDLIDLTGNHTSVDGKNEHSDLSCNGAFELDPSFFHALFPIPSHLIPQNSIETLTIAQNSVQSKSLKDIPSWLHSNAAKTSMDISDQFDYNDYNSSDEFCSDLNIFSRTLSTIFDTTSFIHSKIDLVTWSEKYKIQNIPNDVCGSHNIEIAEKLVEFIENWRSRRQEAINTRAEKMREMMGLKRKKPPSKSKTGFASDDDEFSDSGDELDDCSLSNVLLLTGPVGSGKTSLVYAIAAKCQCVVLEVNTTMKRSGIALKNIIEESTQSHSNLALLKGGITQDLDEITIEENVSSKDNASLSLVLIDEVDLVFENDGDGGFWSSLQNLTKRALSPIILIASHVPKPLLASKLIRFVHLSTERPTPMECASKVCQIAKQEGMTWMKNTILHDNALKIRLGDFAKLCYCDIRKILNELHLFTTSMYPADLLDRCSVAKHKKELDKNEKTHSANNDLALKLGYPLIKSIAPRTISSTESTMLTITGENFLLSNFPSYSVQILLGRRRLLDVHILDDKTITGMTSKFELPTSFNSFDVKSLRYVPIIFRVVNSKGITVLTSDSSISSLNSDGLFTSQPNIELLYPESIGFMEARSKAHLERLRCKKGKSESICVSNGFDSEAPAFPMQHTHVIDQDASDCLLDHSQVNCVASSSYSDPCELAYCSDNCADYYDAVKVEENVSREESHTINEDVNDPVIVTPTSQELSKIGLEDCMEDYLQMSLVDSDTQYLLDSLDHVGLPLLSGPVAELTSIDCEEVGYGRSLLLRGNTLTNYCFSGANEAYLTRPSSIRDRNLLTRSSNYSRGLAIIPSQLSSVRAFHSKDYESEVTVNTAKGSMELIQTADEDSFLHWYVPPSLSLLPSSVREMASRLYNFTGDRNRLHSIVVDYDRDRRMERLLELILILFHDSLLPFDFSNEWVRVQWLLDYIPCLRNMAYFEKSKNSYQTTSSTQRQTRRSASKAHYFEAHLKCASGISVANELNEVRLSARAEFS